MAKARIVVSSDEDDESNTNFSGDESPLVSDDNGDIDVYDEEEEEEEDYKPHQRKLRATAQTRRKKSPSKSQDDLLEDDDVTSLSNDEESDMDVNFDNEVSTNDLDAKEDDDYEVSAPARKNSIRIKIKPPTKRERKSLSGSPSSSTSVGNSRNTRKRQVNYYQEEEEEDDNFSDISDIEQPKSTKRVKVKAMPARKLKQPHLDPDLILTDEEEEYDPNSANDVSKMTERQRARLNTDVPGATIEDPYFELDAGSGKKPKQKKVKEETEEEAALRKAENARKRQDYKNKILEEEKRDTLNNLLKRRATKSREMISEDKEGSIGIDEDSKSYYKERRATLNHPALIRYVNNTTTLNGNSVLAYK